MEHEQSGRPRPALARRLPLQPVRLCRLPNGLGGYFRQCSQFREWFTGRWQGYQITMEELKAKSR